MINNKNVIKVLVLGVLLLLCNVVVGCGEKANHDKKTTEDIAKLSIDEERIASHHHADASGVPFPARLPTGRRCAGRHSGLCGSC